MIPLYRVSYWIHGVMNPYLYTFTIIESETKGVLDESLDNCRTLFYEAWYNTWHLRIGGFQ